MWLLTVMVIVLGLIGTIPTRQINDFPVAEEKLFNILLFSKSVFIMGIMDGKECSFPLISIIISIIVFLNLS